MPHDDTDLSAADEYWCGYAHGSRGDVPHALLHPDPEYARRYRAGYLAGRREAKAERPASHTDTPADEIPF